ncbi:MAG: hypothetical protein M3083_06025 [Actinomycetota bacterium]|nr:hypothetical protein [Actinomycetota bacterium]
MIKRFLIVALALALPVTMLAGCGSGSSAKVAASKATTATAAATTSSGDAATSSTDITSSSGTTAVTGRTYTSGSAGSGGTSTTRVVAGGTLGLSNAADGTTVRVVKSTTIVVSLSSTYWRFLPTAPFGPVLQQVGDVTIAPARIGTCIPGAGCGTASVTYKAVGTGQAQISASRTTCGEAMLCQGKAGSYSVQVVVTAR